MTGSQLVRCFAAPVDEALGTGISTDCATFRQPVCIQRVDIFGGRVAAPAVKHGDIDLSAAPWGIRAGERTMEQRQCRVRQHLWIGVELTLTAW
jgi:hypothetical protein